MQKAEEDYVDGEIYEQWLKDKTIFFKLYTIDSQLIDTHGDW